MTLLIGGEKGGSGKTTLAANIAAWCARRRQELPYPHPLWITRGTTCVQARPAWPRVGWSNFGHTAGRGIPAYPIPQSHHHPPNPMPDDPRYPLIFPEAWASAWGEDEHGLWMAFTYQGVRHAFRWIEPGRFWMGSPNDEPERWAVEGPRHQVTLTQGFWLGEAAVTQSLWEVVMGENPSEFKGPDRPVENVSWDNARAFLDKLNGERDDLGFRLPSEAEWEYACRAGTQTPFSFGANITPEEVNYYGDHPYVAGKTGLNRKQTVDVKALPCNPWGLYQMHGNVWEWCQDWKGDYPTQPVTDPEGPPEGIDRVLRGGSWVDYAGNCRSAFRIGGVPVGRGRFAGFRLARGRTSPAGREGG